jgi:hypothetical protein
MASVKYISDTEEIVKSPWSVFQQDGAPAFNWPEGSPLAPALPAKYLTGEQTQVLNLHQIKE